MSQEFNRREVLGLSTALAGGMALASTGTGLAAQSGSGQKPSGRKYQLGTVTYNIAAHWDVPTLLKVCKDVGLTAVEFRTTHKHGVEPALAKPQRAEIRKRCADAGLRQLSLGTVCQFHEADPAVVARNVETCKQFIDLASDLGAKGVKVRPNGLPKGVAVEKTLEQIGKALRTCGQAAADAGVEVWVEVHGSGTSHPPHMRTIMDVADHPAVGITWNSNGTDLKDGSIKEYFELLRPRLRCCHINELTSSYPWRELFGLLNAAGYDRYTLIEIAGLECDKIGDATRFLRFYKALWNELSGPAE
ncbi:MAG: sugar phosphate isomerase/epimerase [Phycisphaerae bacterium]|jgi:sugar phosphate isomerase/epimerase